MDITGFSAARIGAAYIDIARRLFLLPGIVCRISGSGYLTGSRSIRRCARRPGCHDAL